MKKFATILSIVLCATLLSSCRGRDGLDGVGTIKTVYISVGEDKWAYSNQDNNNYFYATVEMPEITKAVFNGGIVKMYRCFDNSQMEMPYVRLNEYEYEGDWYFYTETVDYEFAVGAMTIFYTASDFEYELDKTLVPVGMQFRCVVMY